MPEDQAWPDLPVETAECSWEHCDADEDGLRAGVSGSAPAAAEGGVEELLAAVAGLAAQAIPGVDGVAVVMLWCPADGALPRIESRAVTAKLAGQIDSVQYEIFGEGPGLTCIELRCPVVSAALGSDQRWPRFAGRVARLGVQSAMSVPLLIADHVVGVTTYFAFDRDVFGQDAVRVGAQFAGPAAVSVYYAQMLVQARATVERLNGALENRPVIEQAIGIIRARTGVSTDDGFDRLRKISQAQNTKLNVVAQQLVEQAVCRAQARHKPT